MAVKLKFKLSLHLNISPYTSKKLFSEKANTEESIIDEPNEVQQKTMDPRK